MSEKIQNYIADLNQSDPMRQLAAAESLAGLAEEAKPAMVALIGACSSQDEDVMNWCTAALESVGPPELHQIEDLTLLANSANADVAYWAVTMLGRAHDQAAPAVSVLIERLTDSSAPQVQRRAAWALGKLGRSANAAILALRTLAESSDSALAHQAQESLDQVQAS